MSETLSRKQRAARWRRGIVVALAATFAVLAVAPSANAIDYVSAGSASKGPYKISYSFGYEYYSLTMSDAWSWTSGNSSTTRVWNVRGTTTSTANLNNQTTNAIGPVDSARNPISSGTYYGNAMVAYHFMQARACLIEAADFVCNGWTWHRGHATLHSGGTWTPVGDY
ncbi:hypothetical protein [Cellulomonas sp.]|uniref:hypothetical protein n=1 Tax=Cellulomonas sp. TaxID=40001 RepID=UPI001B2B074E|nr:hypothetical protein [Cellulomonas sp.]MBO9553219.1 hypothetical protein [Cellulomonas sp.]